jgi:hypothetical protein
MKLPLAAMSLQKTSNHQSLIDYPFDWLLSHHRGHRGIKSSSNAFYIDLTPK